MNNADNGNSMETALIVICWIFAILLMVSVVGYVYLRLKMGPNLHRLPSDHHELTLQGPIVEVVRSIMTIFYFHKKTTTNTE